MAVQDYSLRGDSAKRALDSGLAAAQWYHTDVPRTQMKALMERRDGPAIRDTVIYYGAMILFAGIGIALWPSWWSVPFWFGYGVLYGSGSDSRWHEAGHNTAFKTRWMNTVVYQIACFMIIRNPVVWRCSHFRHHADTIIVGRDPEIAIMRPPDAVRLALNVFGLPDAIAGWKRMWRNALGQLDPEEAIYVPNTRKDDVFFVARVWLVIYATTIYASIVMGSILPLMVIGLPRLFGAWHHVMTGYLQHGGLADNVLDHRLNTRTVYMNPISRFIYLNMNYHIEHHMFPLVPYHRLPELHARIKDDLPEPDPSILAAYRRMLPILARQLRGENVFLKRQLPATAKPYREDFHADAVPLAGE